MAKSWGRTNRGVVQLNFSIIIGHILQQSHHTFVPEYNNALLQRLPAVFVPQLLAILTTL